MLDTVDVRLTIGEFAKMSYLTVKALRHYHDVGLLEPVAVDPATGYRSYTAEQVATAQAIRRFRDLDMPIDRIREVLGAPDPDTRNRAILEHLEQMQHQLERTQRTVGSLQALLQRGASSATVEHRAIPTTLVMAITDTVECADSGEWCSSVFAELHEALADSGATPAGPDGALYPDEFFETGVGRLMAFVPIAERPVEPSAGRAAVVELPAAELAVLLHEGSFDELDRTYGVLGTYVAANRLSAGGPIRERYLTDDHTEVCWPILTAP